MSHSSKSCCNSETMNDNASRPSEHVLDTKDPSTAASSQQSQPGQGREGKTLGSLQFESDAEILEALFIREEQRIPEQQELQLWTVPAHLSGLSPEDSVPTACEYARNRTSHAAFLKQAFLWSYLAGDRSSFWCRDAREPPVGNRPLYAPLDVTKKEIRVLKITCTRRDDGHGQSFRASLIPVSLADEDPQYLAISYAWGDPSPIGRFERHPDGCWNEAENEAERYEGNTIEYNKAVLAIVSTLVQPGATLYLWIDAVCINQNDLDERANQVTLMGQVYSRARQVVVFVGEADDDAARALDLAGDFNRFRSIVGDHLNFSGQDELAAACLRAGLDRQVWLYLLRLFLRPWFYRYWVIQEVVLGTNPVMICGRHAASWSDMVQTCQWANKSSVNIGTQLHQAGISRVEKQRLLAASDRGAHVCRLENLRTYGHDTSAAFTWILRSFDTCRTTDPRDRIFAILGLPHVAGMNTAALKPDYTIKVEDLYVRAAKGAILQGEAMPTLAFAGMGYRRSLNLPSWVPDWTCLPAAFGSFWYDAREADYYTIRGTQVTVSWDQGCQGALSLEGHFVDNVSVLSSPILSGDVNFLGYDPEQEAWPDEVLELSRASQKEQQDESQTTKAAKAAAEQTDSRPEPWRTRLAHTLAASFGAPSAALHKSFEAFLLLSRVMRSGLPASWMISLEDHHIGLEYASLCHTATKERRFFISSDGHFGLAPPGTRQGDQVCIFSGFRTPFVVRSAEPEAQEQQPGEGAVELRSYILIGEAYHYGLISGELTVGGPAESIRLV
ncbi:HET-domain-containing protein [Cryphonectria parasitica EP155]|uniref:HET-domain-containing protein n=1 Tax=Cryphonectria parasitica (strain ATCC 38755 / EP155) TaxID=660469 RepID=A0A9P5CKI0_CRYP1|nr:HET-domain-containing protein [Cryphonectria parasitica EP155]KAF3762093.1 HET-domain-containing protein [Cryphonectria parasitica EP155]